MLAEGCNRIGLGTALQRMLNRAVNYSRHPFALGFQFRNLPS